MAETMQGVSIGSNMLRRFSNKNKWEEHTEDNLTHFTLVFREQGSERKEIKDQRERMKPEQITDKKERASYPSMGGEGAKIQKTNKEREGKNTASFRGRFLLVAVPVNAESKARSSALLQVHSYVHTREEREESSEL
jgi:hypothetical protein